MIPFSILFWRLFLEVLSVVVDSIPARELSNRGDSRAVVVKLNDIATPLSTTKKVRRFFGGGGERPQRASELDDVWFRMYVYMEPLGMWSGNLKKGRGASRRSLRTTAPKQISAAL